MNQNEARCFGVRMNSQLARCRVFCGMLAVALCLGASVNGARAQGVFSFTNSISNGFQLNTSNLVFTLSTNGPSLLVLDSQFTNFLVNLPTNWSSLVVWPTNTTMVAATNLQVIAWANEGTWDNRGILTASQVFPPTSVLWPSVPGFGAPTNDNFANAIVLSGSAFAASAPNYFATAEPGEPQHIPGTPAAQSTWWRWTADYEAETTVTIGLFGGTLVVYSGETLESLERVTLVTSSNIIMSPYRLLNPSASFMAHQGQSYYIAVEGSVGAWSLEQKLLEFSLPVPERGWVGKTMELEVSSLETNEESVTVDFLVGGQRNYSGYSTLSSPVPGLETVVLMEADRILSQVPVLTNLGTVTAPPYRSSWTPAEPGQYLLWARSTNSLGEVHESTQAPIRIFAANDDFDGATVISPETVSTNFEFSTSWGSAETNEPTHKAGTALRSLWWKWTPSYSGKVRLKAVRNMSGLSVEAFTGSDLTHLRRIADNRGNTSVQGKSGLVYLSVKAGTTYFIRVDEDVRMRMAQPTSRTLGSIVADSVLSIDPAKAPLPGVLNFSLIAGSYWDRQRGRIVIPFARVFQADGKTRLTGFEYLAQLYVGATPGNLTPVGDARPFYPNGTRAGLFFPTPVFLPNTVAGNRVWAQIRVWDSTFGQSFEEAHANGSPVGRSKIASVKTGSERVGPMPLWGISSFTLQGPSN